MRASDKIPEWIRSDGDSFAGRGRKVQSGARAGRDGGFQARPQHSHGRGGRGVDDKMPSSRMPQSAASLAERILAGYEFGPSERQDPAVMVAPRATSRTISSVIIRTNFARQGIPGDDK